VISLHHAQASQPSPEAWLNETVEGLRRRFGGATVKDTTIQLAGRTLRGRRLDGTLGGMMIRHEFFLLETKDRPWLLGLQDNIDDRGAGSREGAEARRLLEQSFALD
jgi:hypothetical protein